MKFHAAIVNRRAHRYCLFPSLSIPSSSSTRLPPNLNLNFTLCCFFCPQLITSSNIWRKHSLALAGRVRQRRWRKFLKRMCKCQSIRWSILWLHNIILSILPLWKIDWLLVKLWGHFSFVFFILMEGSWEAFKNRFILSAICQIGLYLPRNAGCTFLFDCLIVCSRRWAPWTVPAQSTGAATTALQVLTVSPVRVRAPCELST